MAAQGAYGVEVQVNVVWVPAGASAMTQAASQKKAFFPSSTSATGLPNTGMAALVPVPGGSAPSAANFNTATNNAISDIQTQIAAALTQLQGFATGGG